MSFNRQQYQDTYEFAREVFAHTKALGLKVWAAHLMAEVENVIGQQSDFPLKARKILGNK